MSRGRQWQAGPGHNWPKVCYLATTCTHLLRICFHARRLVEALVHNIYGTCYGPSATISTLNVRLLGMMMNVDVSAFTHALCAARSLSQLVRLVVTLAWGCCDCAVLLLRWVLQNPSTVLPLQCSATQTHGKGDSNHASGYEYMGRSIDMTQLVEHGSVDILGTILLNDDGADIGPGTISTTRSVVRSGQ